MKDFVLSLLSRGNGQIVPDESGNYERLEVCFEPEDYFNWKSQPPLLRFTSSGQILGGVEPVPPKTYSTRRGPLILYSEDLATSCQTSQVNRKRKAPSGPESHLHTLQDLATAILAYGKKQSKAGSLAGVTHPLIPDTKHASQHIHVHQKTKEKHHHLNQCKAEKDGHVRYQPRFLCSPPPNRATLGPMPPITKGLVHIQSQEKTHLASVSAEKCEQVRYQPCFLHSPRLNRTTQDPLPPITEGLVHIQSQEKTHQEPDEQITFKTKGQLKPKVKIRQSHRTEAESCKAPMSPIPEITAAQTEPADQTILPHLIDHTKDPNGREKRSLMENRSGAGEMCTLRSVYLDSSLECSPLSRLNYYGGHMEGFRQFRHCGGETQMKRVTTETHPSLTISHLPPIKHSPQAISASSDHLIDYSTSNKPKTNNMGSCENPPQRNLKVHIPDITLGATHVNQPERSVHRKVLVLLPPQTEITETPMLHDEQHETHAEDRKPCGNMDLDEEPPQREQDPLSDSRCRIIEMHRHVVWSDNLEQKDKNPPLGPLPPLVGRRGLGKQSSMAVYSQSLHDPADTEEAQTGNIRGCLPPELRERQAGTLIMGPDGEIIRLSLWDPAVDTEDHPIMGDVTHSHVLKVVTSEGDLKQPWTILIQDYAADKAGDVTAHNTEATATNKKQLDSSHEVFMDNKPAEQTNAKKRNNHLSLHNTTVKTEAFTDNTYTKTNAEKEQEEDEEVEQEEVEEKLEEDEDEEDYLGSDNEVKTQVFLVYAHVKQNTAEDYENHFASDNAITQETQVSSRVKTNAKRKKMHLATDTEIIQEAQANAKRNGDCLSSDDEIIQEGEVVKNNSHIKRTNTKRKVYLASDNEINQKEEVYLPDERLEELRRSTDHLPGRQGEGTTAVQRNRKGKTTTLQPETGVTLGSRKSKGAAPAINPKSTQFTPTTYTSGQSLSPHGQTEIQTGLPVESAFKGKGQSENTGGTEDVEHKPLKNVKKNKKINKQTSKSKRKTVQINKDDEIQNRRVFDETTATSKQKEKKTKEMTEEEKVEHRLPEKESQNPKVKAKKKKGQPAFVVGKPRPQEVEWKENQVVENYERETYETNERETFETNERETYDTDDDKLDNSVSHYIDSGDDTDADTDSVSTQTHEAHDSPRTVYSAHRSHYSQFTALSHPSIHRLSQSSHRTTSMGVAASCGPCSPATLSLINLPPQTAQHPAPDPTKSKSDNNLKSSEEPHTKKQDTKAAALAERAERRRLEVERKRKEKEEEKKRQQEKEVTEERMRMELEEEQQKRAEETRLRKVRDEEERRRRQEKEMERQRREQAEKERERRRQEEKRRLLERLQRERQEEEKRQAAELERKRLEEEAQKEEERIRLSEMEEAERLEYLRRRQEEEEERRKAAEERKRRDEEAAMRMLEEARLQAELFDRQREALEQHLKFHRGLFVEAGGLEQTQDISRPWVFSYFALLKLLGLAESTSAHEDALTDVL